MDRQKVDKHLGLTVASLLTLLLLLLGVGWAAAAPRSPQQVVPVWGPDVRANSDDTNWSQHEPHLAISRTDPDVVVVVAKDYRVANNKEVWIYVSQDGGQTWPLEKQRKVPVDLPDIPNQSDPIAMARDDGRIYVVCLGHGGGHGLFITWTDDDGDTWQDPAIHITYNETPGGLDDKEWLAIDNNPDSPQYHNMYVAWANGGILFKRSTDGGQTWSSYVNLTPGGDTEYPYPIVGADGALYVFYMDGWGYCADGYIKYRKSTDGGVTFDPPVTVVATSQPCSPIHGYYEYDQWRFFSIITAAADPNNPDNLWAAWTDDNDITYGKTDVLYVRSTDSGATWSAPERLSHDDPDAYVDHITPVFAIGAESRLHAFWLDRRDDPANHLFHGYHTSTADGGDTWEPDSRVSDEPFDLNLYFPPPSGYNAAGDYWGLDVVGVGAEQIVMAAWNTTVETSQDIYVSRGVFTTTVVTLTGQVSDALTLTPIEGAEVTADPGPTVTTGPDGVYTMTLAPGVYDVTAAASGYVSQTIAGLEVLTGTVVQDFSLEPAPTYTVTLTGQVSDVLTLAPLEGAEVTADPGPTVTTGPDGVYTMTLAPGVYDVTAAASGYVSQTIAGLEVLTGTVVQDFGLAPLPCPDPVIHGVQVLTDDLTVSFTAAISFTPPISYLWAFGDGATSSLPAPSHTYAVQGVYSFTLTVTDDCGLDLWSDRVVLPAPPLRIYVPVVYKLQP